MATKKLMNWRKRDPDPNFVDRNRACPYQLRLFGIIRKFGRTTLILVIGPRRLDAVTVTKYLLNLLRNRLSILVSLITGHYCLGFTPNPICGACSIEAESAFHFVCVCPALAIFRTRIMDKPIINALKFAEIVPSDILRFASLSGRFCSDLLTFWYYAKFSIFNFFLSPILSIPLTGSSLSPTRGPRAGDLSPPSKIHPSKLY
jgi:hypothetical protein